MNAAAGPIGEETACRLCGGPSVRAFEVGDRNRGLGEEKFAYRRCAACGSTFIETIPPDLARYYESDGYGTVAEGVVPIIVERERDKLAMLARFATRGSIIEIGPGPGTFARAAKDAGYDVTAIEMDAGYCRALQDELGLRAIESDDPAAVLPTLEPSAAVVMWHVIEHLPDPYRVVEAAVSALAPGGVLAISAPNPQSLQFRMLGSRWAHLDAPRHLQLIPPGTLRSRVAQLGAGHALTTTTDLVGLECNRLGWEYAVRLHPAQRPSTRVTRRAASLLTRLFSPVERHGMAGAAYTSFFISS